MLTSQTNLAIDNALSRLFSNSALKKPVEMQKEISSVWRNLHLIKPLRIADMEKIEEDGMPFSEDCIFLWAKGFSEENDPEVSNNIVSRWISHIADRVDLENICNYKYKDVLTEWKKALVNPDIDLRTQFAKKYFENANVLCMTCGNVGSKEFKDFKSNSTDSGNFDVVIVDEASKATLPELLMPLYHAKKSIIIGDHRQLPPMIFESEFFENIFEANPELGSRLDDRFKHELVEESIFKRLITHSNVSPTIKATFNIQYRMHPNIGKIVSKFYNSDSGGLRCGLLPDRVDKADFSDHNSRYHGLMLGGFISPKVHTIWVDVPDGKETSEGTSTYNEKEVEAVRLVLEALSRSVGFDEYMNYWQNHPDPEIRRRESKIGVISFYASQIGRIRQSLSGNFNKSEISTMVVDRFQGQERGIVIVSTVRTRSLGFTRTPERLNVALSRARRLLIIVGNSDFYTSDRARISDDYHIYKNVIDNIKSEGVFINYQELKNILNENDYK